MKITIETTIEAPLPLVWETWNSPEDIKRWNSAHEDWHTTESSVDLREGGSFRSRMEAKDGSVGFDFGGEYTRVERHERIDYRMSDGREVEVEFRRTESGVHVRETFDAETENPPEMQRDGWQAILDNFKRHTEAKAGQTAT